MIDADRELVGSVHDSEVACQYTYKYVDGECTVSISTTIIHSSVLRSLDFSFWILFIGSYYRRVCN
jgi:hypothetical protein